LVKLFGRDKRRPTKNPLTKYFSSAYIFFAAAGLTMIQNPPELLQKISFFEHCINDDDPEKKRQPILLSINYCPRRQKQKNNHYFCLLNSDYQPAFCIVNQTAHSAGTLFPRSDFVSSLKLEKHRENVAVF
jgi:hypothetical protein